MKYTFSAAAALAATFSLAFASDQATCGAGSSCPESAPCCSQYGQCGVGAYCLGGCDPRYSFSLESCKAAPVCKSADYKLDSLDDVAANTVYLGDPSSVNWVSSGMPVVYQDEAILLTMAPSTVGTLLMSTHYVWYGKICATMQSSQGKGVVTAFILMSDVQDEIDFEFVGDNVDQVESNYYWQGVLDYENGKGLDVSDTRVNEHEYCIDWKPDSLEWTIDGNVARTLDRESTFNSTTSHYDYPQTPARVQLSLWPAGLSTNGEGTIEWAGGLVDWDSQYMQNGYYYAIFKDVSVECYDHPDGWSNQGNGDSAYYYMSRLGTNDTIAIGNNDTTLASFQATGDDPEFDPNASTATSSASSSATSTPESVPGLSGGGAQQVGSGSSSSSSNGDTGSAAGSGTTDGGGSGSQSAPGAASTVFSQGLTDSTSGAGARHHGANTVAGSAVALLGFFIAALML